MRRRTALSVALLAAAISAIVATAGCSGESSEVVTPPPRSSTTSDASVSAESQAHDLDVELLENAVVVLQYCRNSLSGDTTAADDRAARRAASRMVDVALADPDRYISRASVTRRAVVERLPKQLEDCDPNLSAQVEEWLVAMPRIR